MNEKVILNTEPMDFMLPVSDPFLFCAHHYDLFPAGNSEMGPDASLNGRDLGQDFTIKDGWRMYHGETIPGFPAHPHRGFETVTVVLQGFVDHADSYGQAGRYGNGDVQWMTAGAGLQHSEMFPLLNRDNENPGELFQIWINLPKSKKMVTPHFKMLWSEDIPKKEIVSPNGKSTVVNIIAGKFEDVLPLKPAPDSWAEDPANDVAIWLIHMDAGAECIIPPAETGSGRRLYFYNGSTLKIEDQEISKRTAIEVKADAGLHLVNGNQNSSILLLQGKPINEPVVQYGPFVMNTKAEIQQTYNEFQTTRFGGWPWPRPDQVFPREKGRFAAHADGRIETRSEL